MHVVKIRGKIDLKINWSVKMLLHEQKGVAHSRLWALGYIHVEV